MKSLTADSMDTMKKRKVMMNWTSNYTANLEEPIDFCIYKSQEMDGKLDVHREVSNSQVLPAITNDFLFHLL